MNPQGDMYDLFLEAMDALQAEAFEEARDRLYVCLERIHETADPNNPLLARVHLLLGQVNAELGDEHLAREHLSHANDLFRDLGDAIGQARVRLELGELAYWDENFVVARKHFERVVRLLEADEESDLRTLAHAYVRLGGIAFEEDEIDAARQAYERAMRYYDKIGDTKNAAEVLIELASGLHEEDPREAEHLFLRGRDLAQMAGSDYLTSLAFHGLGVLAADRGEWEQAITYYKQALHLKSRCGDHEGQIFTYLALGVAERKLGSEEKAAQMWQEAIRLARREGLGEVEEIARLLIESKETDWLER